MTKTYTAAMLAEHRLAQHNIGMIGDGYDQMQALSERGWRACAAWGLRGWDLGSWPYVAVYTRKDDPTRFRVVTEGDVDEYAGFDGIEDRNAAIDHTFVWWAVNNGERWAAGWDPENPPEEARGPYSNERYDAWQAAQAPAAVAALAARD